MLLLTWNYKEMLLLLSTIFAPSLGNNLQSLPNRLYLPGHLELQGLLFPNHRHCFSTNRADTFNNSSLRQAARSPCFRSSSHQLPFQFTAGHFLALCLVSLSYLLIIPWCALCCPRPLLFSWSDPPHPSSPGSFRKPNIPGHFFFCLCFEKSLPLRSRPLVLCVTNGLFGACPGLPCGFSRSCPTFHILLGLSGNVLCFFLKPIHSLKIPFFSRWHNGLCGSFL